MSDKNDLKIGEFNDVALSPDFQKISGHAADMILFPEKLPRFCRHRRYGHWAKKSNAVAKPQIKKLPRLEPDAGESFLYGGFLCWHFGHFIAEYIHRLWPVSEPGFANHTVIFVSYEEDFINRPFFRPVMAYFGIKKWKIITEPTIISRLVIAEAGHNFREPFKPAYMPKLQQVFQQHSLMDSSYPEKVAMMRGHLKNRARLLGELDFTRMLESKGYVSFIPENHDIFEQIKTIVNAKKIIITEGSACHLFDLLPRLYIHVAYIARRVTGKIGHCSIKPKVAKYSAYLDCSLLTAPTVEKGRVKKARVFALTLVNWKKIIEYLKDEDFLDESVPHGFGPDYIADIRSYLGQFGQSDAHAPLSDNQIVEKLLELIEKRDKYIREHDKKFRLYYQIRRLFTGETKSQRHDGYL